MLTALSALCPEKATAQNVPDTPQAIFIPLDDRPSTFLFPQQIARIAGGQLIFPDRSVLGKAYTPGNTQQIGQWLKDNGLTSSKAIISADMLAYGGLIASRTSKISQDDALDNLEVLNYLNDIYNYSDNPSLKNKRICVFTIIPRLSLRTSDAQAPYEQALANWASSGKSHIPEKVPPEILQEYLSVRSRNIAVIKKLIELTSNGVIQHLVIGQDDSSKKGLHKGEQATLTQMIADLNIKDKVTLISGADELAMNITAGWLCEENDINPLIEINYSDIAAASKIPPLESKTLDETIDEHIQLSGARRSYNSTINSAATVLLVETPSDKPYAVPQTTVTSPQDLERVNDLGVRIRSARYPYFGPVVGTVRDFGMADLRLVNRADPLLADKLIETVPLWEVDAYAAWNTSSNSLGTAISQIVAHHIAKVKGPQWSVYKVLESEKTHKAFTFARLIDDYAYQAVIRQSLQEQVKGLPRDPDPLLNLYGPIGIAARTEAISWAEQIWKTHLKDKTYQIPSIKRQVRFEEMHLEVVLPWPRIFEIEARLDLRLELLPKSPVIPTKKSIIDD